MKLTKSRTELKMNSRRRTDWKQTDFSLCSFIRLFVLLWKPFVIWCIFIFPNCFLIFCPVCQFCVSLSRLFLCGKLTTRICVEKFHFAFVLLVLSILFCRCCFRFSKWYIEKDLNHFRFITFFLDSSYCFTHKKKFLNFFVRLSLCIQSTTTTTTTTMLSTNINETHNKYVIFDNVNFSPNRETVVCMCVWLYCFSFICVVTLPYAGYYCAGKKNRNDFGRVRVS